jgi:RNA polymerase sigma-70 factor (ECF subfamily)
MEPMREQELVASCQAGRLEDFSPLYSEYVKPIFGFLYRRTLDRQTAEDLTSITFMKALEKITQYSPAKGNFGAWLYRIARNSLTDHYRALRPHEDIESVWDLSSDDDVTQTVHDRLSFETVKAALANVDAAKREIVMMRIWEGLSYQEIAQVTGKTETNCKVIFCRTMESLRKELPLATLLFLVCFPHSL